MLTPEEFPYIKSIHVNDCYTYQNFDINLFDYPDKPFSHLILTGKNGSGKSTILKAIDNQVVAWRSNKSNESYYLSGSIEGHINTLQNLIANKLLQFGEGHSEVTQLQNQLDRFKALTISYSKNPQEFWINNKYKSLYSFLIAKRESNPAAVNSVTKEQDFIESFLTSNSTEYFTKKFKQYLVNKKISQAFAQLKNDNESINKISSFFNDIENILKKVFEDDSLELDFIQDSFDFQIKLSNNRSVSFNELSDGISSLLSVIIDLLMRVDLIRSQRNSPLVDPCGIVLIDEPETHLHIQLQEQVLPILTSLFPNIQFIAATHSPAVISSIKHATIFDLTTKEAKNDEVAGRSYSDLMMTHFGLDNEYSNIADEIIKEVNTVLNNRSLNPAIRHIELQKIYDDSSKFLSPTLKIELELLLAKYQSNISAAE